MKTLSTVFGVIVCAISTFILGSYIGFGAGTHICQFQYPVIPGIGWVSDLNPYHSLTNLQQMVVALLIGFLLGKLLDGVVGNWIRLVSIVGVLFFLVPVLFSGSNSLNIEDEYLRLHREMYVYQIVVIVMSAIVLGLEAISLKQRFYSARERAPLDDAGGTR